MTYIGIDVGKKGGVAIIEDGDEEIVTVFPWDDAKFTSYMRWFANKMISSVAYVEKVGAMHGQGVVSMFNFGHSAGFIEGVLTGLAIPHQLVPPKVWKKEYSLGNDKQESISVCHKLFPDVCLLPTSRCTKESDGMAEALLIAEYARRHSNRGCNREN